MVFAVQNFKKPLIFATLLLVSLVIAFLPVSETFAAYKSIPIVGDVGKTGEYRSTGATYDFIYSKGGLGVKVSCMNSQSANQTMQLQRHKNERYYTGENKTIKCNGKEQYVYYSNPVKGGIYRLWFKNTKPGSYTYIYVHVNPN